MATDVTKIVGGPADVQIADVSISHTQGGVTVTVTPKNRMRTVDQYGESPVAVIHTGDQCKVTAPFAEWTAAVLAQVYDPGVNNVAYLGVGRSAGFLYTPADLKVIPFLTADAAKKAQFPKAVPVGELSLAFNNDDDRVFNAEFEILADPAAADGELMGKIFLTTPI